MQVSEILAIKGKVLYTISPERSLTEAVATMSEHDVGSLVVFEHGKMVGMLSFRELIKAIHEGGAAWQEKTIADAMESQPLTATPNMEMDELRRHMVSHRKRYLPVMDADVLMGVVSFHDVAVAVLEEQSFENRMLKNYIRNWPAEADES